MLTKILAALVAVPTFAMYPLVAAPGASAAPGCPIANVSFSSTIIFPWDTWFCYGFTDADGMRDYCQRPFMQGWSCDRRPGNPHDRELIACDESGYCGPEVPVPCSGPGAPCG